MHKTRRWGLSGLTAVLVMVGLSRDGAAQSIATDVSIQVSSVDTAIPAPGTFTTFLVKVTNLGSSGNYFQNRVDVELPDEYTEVFWTCTEQPAPVASGSCSSVNSCHPSACPSPSSGTGDIHADVGLAADSSVIFSVKARVPVQTPNPLVVTASVTPSAIVTDPNPNNNRTSLQIYKAADVQLSVKTSTNPSVGHERITWTPNVCNAGPWSAEGVDVTLNLSAGASILRVFGEGWSCSTHGTKIACLQPILPQGACSALWVEVVPEPGVTRISMQAAVALDGLTRDPMPQNNIFVGEMLVSKPDLPSLNGGGWSCQSHVGPQGGAATPLMAFALVGVIAACYRIYRRKR